MTNSPFQDAVAIDTNVFEHILNPQENLDSHINKLLTFLQLEGVSLIVDDRNRITGEYRNRLEPIIRGANETSIEERLLLKYWIVDAPRRITKLVLNDQLMAAIREVIKEPPENVDRILVWVAFRHGRVLISNDRMNIVLGPQNESSARRDRLLNGTGKLRPPGAHILTSQEAYGEI